jgi:hypothetical protein
MERCPGSDAVSERQGTHWAGCWRAHHECAVVLLERILASPEWATECEEFGCHDDGTDPL